MTVARSGRSVSPFDVEPRTAAGGIAPVLPPPGEHDAARDHHRPRRGRSAMHARAAVSTVYSAAPGRPGRSRLTTLRSQTPLVLRPTAITTDVPWAGTRSDVARVSLAAGAAGPVGGDQLSLDISVGPGSTLVLSEISASLLLPGVHGERSSTRTRIQVAAGGTLVWLPQPVIAARGCHHLNDVRVELEEGARLLMREELLLGRHGETPGSLAQRVQVRLGGRPLYHQHLDLGPAAPGGTVRRSSEPTGRWAPSSSSTPTGRTGAPPPGHWPTPPPSCPWRGRRS